MNGNVDISGTITGASTVQGTVITATTGFAPDASDGAYLGTSSLQFSDLFLADGAILNLGDDQDVTLTHVADTGVLLNSSRQLQFGDSGTYIHQSADGVLDLVSDTEIEINATTIDINGAVDISGATVFGSAGSGVDVTFYSATSGDHMLWDASDEKLVIIGTNGQNALEVTDGNVAITDNLTVSGDLTVSGSTTTISTTNLTVTDPLIKLAQGTTASPTNDLGIIFTRGNGSSSNIANRAILWDESADIFVFANTNDEAGTTTGNVDIDDYASIRVGAITADDNSTFTGTITAATGSTIGNLTLANGSITDSSGAIDFGNETLTTTGAVDFGAATVDSVTSTGDFTTTGQATDWDLIDNNSSALSFDASGKAGILNIVTTNSSEGVTMSGDLDVDGTTNLDAVDIDGAVQIDATVTIGANDQGYDVIFYGDTASANVTWDTSADDLIFNGGAGLIVPDGQLTLGSTAISSTAAEINLIDGGTARGTTAVASGDGILINDGGTMRMTNVDTVSTYFASHSVGGGNIVTTGALNSGSITSGFGAIDIGSSALSTTGSVTLGATSFGDNAITNVGSIALDSISCDNTANAITFSHGVVPNTVTEAASGNYTPDMSQYTNFILTVSNSNNCTLQDPTDETAGQSGIFVFIQDGTGGGTLSHADDRYYVAGGSSITLSTGANAIDIVPYFVQADGKIHLGAAQKAFSEA